MSRKKKGEWNHLVKYGGKYCGDVWECSLVKGWHAFLPVRAQIPKWSEICVWRCWVVWPAYNSLQHWDLKRHTLREICKILENSILNRGKNVMNKVTGEIQSGSKYEERLWNRVCKFCFVSEGCVVQWMEGRSKFCFRCKGNFRLRPKNLVQ